MRALSIVVLEIRVQRLLHLFHGFVPYLSALNPKMLVEQGSVQAFNEAVALRAANQGRPMLDAFKLEEQFVRVLVRATAKFASVVRENRLDPGFVFLEEGQNVLVEHVHRRQRQLAGVQAAPGVAACGSR